MSSTISPNMNLIVPTIGSESGPQYAFDINSSLTLIDQHNHASGNGVQITPQGLDINADLPFNNNNATLLRSARFTSQPSALTLPADLGAIYVVGADLYYNNTAGTAIRLTQNGSIVGTAGSITGLPSGTASASYASGTFVWESATATAANMDFASAILRNNTANSFGLTLQPPSALSVNYSITLPVLPASTSLLSMDTSGNITAPVIDNSSIVISSGTVMVGAGGITAAMLSPGAVSGMQYQQFANSGTWVAPANVNAVYIDMWGGGGGGGGGLGGGGGGGGSGGGRQYGMVPVTPGVIYTVVVGAGGSGSQFTGATGGQSTFSSPSTTLYSAPGGPGGNPSTGGGTGGGVAFLGILAATGGAYGNPGQATYYATGGAAGGTSQGGGGGAGWIANATGGNGGASTANGSPGNVTNSGAGGGGGGGNANSFGGSGQAGMVTLYWPGV